MLMLCAACRVCCLLRVLVGASRRRTHTLLTATPTRLPTYPLFHARANPVQGGYVYTAAGLNSFQFCPLYVTAGTWAALMIGSYISLPGTDAF